MVGAAKFSPIRVFRLDSGGEDWQAPIKYLVPLLRMLVQASGAALGCLIAVAALWGLIR